LYITSGDKLFKLGGYNYMDQSLGEFWQFSFNDKSWNRKTDLPFKFSKAVYLNLNNNLYIVTDEGQVWKCDLINEIYSRLNDSPFKFIWSFASAFAVNGKMIVAVYGQNWQYNDQNDTWLYISSNPIQQQSYHENAFGFSYNGTGYVLQGGENLYKYDILNAIWIKVSEYPGSSGNNSYKVVFVIGSKAYIAATFSNYVGSAPLMYSYQE
jgi:N-acetylneuraminic acid mutarotase